MLILNDNSSKILSIGYLHGDAKSMQNKYTLYKLCE